MPINPNIALGAQTPAPVNFLGQMGQMLALKGAAQEIQGGEELRAAYASGGNINDPEFQRKIMAANPKLGAQLIKTSAETQRISGEALGTAYKNSREALSMVRSPEDLLSYSISQFSDPLIGPSLKARGLTPYTVAANLQKELSTSGFEHVLKKSARGLDGWFKDQTSRRNQDVSSGASYQQAALAREKFEFEKANPGYEYKTLDNGGIAAVNKRTNAVTLLQAPGASPMPAAGATPPVNALAPTAAAPAANLNALINPPVVNQPGAPTIANANALAPTPLRAAPRPGYQYNDQGQQVPITDPTKVVSTVTDAQGNVRMINASGDVVKTAEGAGKPSPGFEKRQAEIEKLPTAITQASDTLKLIDRMVGAPGGKSKPHEGFSGAVGAGMGMRFIPGTSASDFQAMHEQVTGGAFLQAFNDLKGGGAITEKEGEKATAAITRMKLSTSEKEYIQAAREFQDVVRRGIETAQRKIKSGGAVSPASTGDIAADPSIQSLLDKYK
jgi:hypothetical protein